MFSCLLAYTIDNQDEITQYLQEHPNSQVILESLVFRIQRIWNRPYLHPFLSLEQDMEDGTIALIIQFAGTDQPVLDAQHLFQLRQERAREELEPMRSESVIVRILYDAPTPT